MTPLSMLHYTNWSTHNVPVGVMGVEWNH